MEKDRRGRGGNKPYLPQLPDPKNARRKKKVRRGKRGGIDLLGKGSQGGKNLGNVMWSGRSLGMGPQKRKGIRTSSKGGKELATRGKSQDHSERGQSDMQHSPGREERGGSFTGGGKKLKWKEGRGKVASGEGWKKEGVNSYLLRRGGGEPLPFEGGPVGEKREGEGWYGRGTRSRKPQVARSGARGGSLSPWRDCIGRGRH